MEYGSVEGAPGQKAQWLKDAETLFKSTGYGQFKAVIQWTGVNIELEVLVQLQRPRPPRSPPG